VARFKAISDTVALFSSYTRALSFKGARLMPGDPYTIRIFVPDGDPEGVRIISRLNWTGEGIVFPREKWPETKSRSAFGNPGVYILVGLVGGEDDDLPTVYVGEGDGIRDRIESHFKLKDFWS
jgi:hypothetical protein